MKKSINVCSTERSGSTLIDLVLGNDEKGFSLGEVYAWFRPFRTHHFDIKCGCGEYPCPVWNSIKHIREKAFHRKAFDTLGSEFLIDSSKNLAWIIDNNIWGMKQNEYKVLNVLVYKNPVSLCYSFWKRGVDIRIALSKYLYYLRFFRTGMQYVTLNYDSFIMSPASKLQILCRVLGIDYFEDKIKFWEKNHHHLFGSYGTRKQVVKKQSTIYKEQYPDIYKNLIPDIYKTLNHNPQFASVFEMLHRKDIGHFEVYPENNANLSIKKSPHYYIDKFTGYIRRYFAQEYPDLEQNLIGRNAKDIR